MNKQIDTFRQTTYIPFFTPEYFHFEIPANQQQFVTIDFVGGKMTLITFSQTKLCQAAITLDYYLRNVKSNSVIGSDM